MQETIIYSSGRHLSPYTIIGTFLSVIEDSLMHEILAVNYNAILRTVIMGKLEVYGLFGEGLWGGLAL